MAREGIKKGDGASFLLCICLLMLSALCFALFLSAEGRFSLANPKETAVFSSVLIRHGELYLRIDEARVISQSDSDILYLSGWGYHDDADLKQGEISVKAKSLDVPSDEEKVYKAIKLPKSTEANNEEVPQGGVYFVCTINAADLSENTYTLEFSIVDESIQATKALGEVYRFEVKQQRICFEF